MARNAANRISMEEIAQMSPEELERLELLPIDFKPSMLISDTPLIDADDGNKDIAKSESLSINPQPDLLRYGRSVEVKNIRQSNENYCGPAATLQAIYAAGYYNDVSGSNDYEKQKHLQKTPC